MHIAGHGDEEKQVMAISSVFSKIKETEVQKQVSDETLDQAQDQNSEMGCEVQIQRSLSRLFID